MASTVVPEKKRKLGHSPQPHPQGDAELGTDPAPDATQNGSTTNGNQPASYAAQNASSANGTDSGPDAAETAENGGTTNGKDPVSDADAAQNGSTTDDKTVVPCPDADGNGPTTNITTPAPDAAEKGSITLPNASENGSTASGSSSASNGAKISISPRALLTDGNLQNEIRERWTAGKNYSDGDFKFENAPFRHAEICNFLSTEDGVLGELVEKVVEKFEFEDKASDLFQFRQSEDLKSFLDPTVSQLIDFLSGSVLEFLRNSTGLPLNNDIDLFLSEYRQTDFLLCHDDELESRRIAFILYLTKDWEPEWGGNLDLYSSTHEFHPERVVKSITPEFNKFVFFEVGATSFHQVSEVRIPSKSRLALSGWFYGESVPRPKIQFPTDQGYSLNQAKIDEQDVFKRLCSESYLKPETQSDINEQLAEESQVLIPGFLKDSTYASICSDIVEQDVRDTETFSPAGPANVRSFQEAFKGPPPPTDLDLSPFQTFRRLFHSEEVLQFLENVTEFPFTSCPIAKVRSSLRKFSNGSYCLLRAGGAKQTGEPSLPSAEEELGEEEEEEPTLVDLTFYFGSKWSEGWGGASIYSTADGEQLITIPPEGNCLTVVVRGSSVHSYVNYINCLAKDEVYFAYTMEFAFDGNFSY